VGGYFANEVFSSIWYHTVYRGAGVWTIDWEIVLGWGDRDEALKNVEDAIEVDI